MIQKVHMNVTIEARALSAVSGGVRTYTYELIKNLLALHPDEHFELIYGSEKPIGTFASAQEIVVPLYSEALLPFWMRSIGKHVASRRPNIVHYTKAAIPRQKTSPTVVTIYDIIPILMPETQSPLRRLYWPHALRHAAKTADHIMTISEGSKRDIMEHFGVAEDKITVTPLAVDLEHFRPKPPTSAHNGATAGKYILFVGTRDARKNIASLIRAFAQIADKIPHNLVIAGRPAKKQDDSKIIAADLHLGNRIEFREDVSYAELPKLYSHADIFVWPSKYEGWGFPPQEAMACGTPVIVSDGTPLPEVVGDAGVIVPLDPRVKPAGRAGRPENDNFTEHLAHEMLTLIQDEPRKADLITRGLARVQQFSWTDVARKTYDVYKKVAI